ncbi:MAG: DUF4957 domain-containing protein [Bacteroidales bacterium]|nr:DUF4957 domain-containing protein [Bacteroidales bacterium]
MNKIFKKINMGLCMSALILSAASCSEPGDIITSVDYARLFSPTDIEARVKDRTSVQVSWSTRETKAEKFIVAVSTDETFAVTDRVVEATSSPCTIKSLDGETQYFVSVKAVCSGNESKWAPAAKFTTDAENICLPMQDGDIQAKSVIVRWTPGEEVHNIEVTDATGALVRAQEVTFQECDEGVAKVEGLTPETTYTLTLKRGGKTRGSITVTTELDLDGATKVTVDDKWYEMLQSANEGDVFAFMPGTYKPYEVEGGTFTGVKIPTSISIKAAKSTDKPVICGVNFKLEAGASLDLINVILNGNNGTEDHADQAIITSADGATDHISVTGCEISRYAKGVIYVNTATAISKIDFNHNFIHDIECNGGDGFDFRKGAAVEFTFTNNSVVNVAAKGKRDLFRMDSGGSSVVPSGTITIKNNNFENCSASGKRVLYIRLGASFPITFVNNVLSNTAAGYSNQKTTIIAEMGNNNYFKAPNFFTPDEAGAYIIDKSAYSEFDPQYNETFLVTNDELKYKNIGNF